jgi:PPOX class probable F420-dependent enzyme
VAVGAVTEELPAWAQKMLLEARVGRLAFLDDAGRPRVLPVTFALEAGSLWSAVDTKPKRVPGREPARVRYLRSRPEAALVVDHYEEDWSALAWVQALGRVQVLAVDQEPGALAALVAKYRPYRDHPPPGPLLRLTPERFITWRATR